MGTGMMLAEASERVLGCDRAGCGHVRKGRHGRFCSDACRAADWKARHGGAQSLLDFRAAEPVPVPHLSSTDPGRLTPNQDFVGHSTESSEELHQRSPTRRQGQGSTERRDFTPAASALAHALRGRETKAQRILARLRQGPATTADLARITGRFSARLQELEERGLVYSREDFKARGSEHSVYTMTREPVGCVPEGE